MKHLIVISLCLTLLGLSISSCHDPKKDGPDYPAVFTVELPENLNFRWDGDAVKINVKSNVSWRVQYESDNEWFAISPDYWDSFSSEVIEIGNVYLVTELNDFTTPRSGHCKIIPAWGRPVLVSLTQDGKPEGVE